jgi:hypothetical protein
MVQIKSTAVALVAAAVIAPAVAYSYYTEDSIVAREDYDDYNEVLARDYGYDLEEREYEGEELALREYDDSELFERDYDDNELLERDPFMGYHHIKKWLSNRKARKQAMQQGQQGGQGGGFGGAPQVPPSDPSMDASAREFDDELEFQAREPEADYEELMQRYFDDLYERELSAEFEDEIAAREFEAEEFDLVQRSPEPGIIEWFKNLFHPKKKAEEKKKAADAAPAAAPAAADPPAAADSAVDAREFEDFYDLD